MIYSLFKSSLIVYEKADTLIILIFLVKVKVVVLELLKITKCEGISEMISFLKAEVKQKNHTVLAEKIR